MVRVLIFYTVGFNVALMLSLMRSTTFDKVLEIDSLFVNVYVSAAYAPVNKNILADNSSVALLSPLTGGKESLNVGTALSTVFRRGGGDGSNTSGVCTGDRSGGKGESSSFCIDGDRGNTGGRTGSGGGGAFREGSGGAFREGSGGASREGSGGVVCTDANADSNGSDCDRDRSGDVDGDVDGGVAGGGGNPDDSICVMNSTINEDILTSSTSVGSCFFNSINLTLSIAASRSQKYSFRNKSKKSTRSI